MSRFEDRHDDAQPGAEPHTQRNSARAAGEPPRDEADALSREDLLRSVLDSAAPGPPVDDVDWMALHARISAGAQPTLTALAAAARSRPPAGAPSLLQPLAGWSPFGIPLAAAATVLLMVGAAVIGTQPVASGDDAAFRTIEEELMTGLGSGAAPFIATAGTEDMLDAVLFYDGEEW